MKRIFLVLALLALCFCQAYSQFIHNLDFPYDNFRAVDEVNEDDSGESYPWISTDGLRLYYTADFTDRHEFVVVERTHLDSAFSTPRILSITSEDYRNLSCWLTEDELEIFFVIAEFGDDGVYRSTRPTKQDTFSAPIPISLEGDFSGFISGVSLSTNQEELFAYNSDTDDNIFIFNKVEANRYVLTDALKIPPGYIPSPGQLSGNDLKYYLSLDDPDGRPSAYVYTRDNINSPFDSLFYLDNPLINNPQKRNVQPTISSTGSFFLIVQSQDDLWSANDIFLASKDEVPSALNNQLVEVLVNAYPNPASTHITLELSNYLDLTDKILIYNNNGILIESKQPTANNTTLRIDLANYANGLYFYEFHNAQSRKAIGSFLVAKN